jgi:transposase-like protein
VKRRRHTPEPIVRKLREADRMLAEGTQVPEVAQALEVSEQTYHRWRAQFGAPTLSPSARACVMSCSASSCSPVSPRPRSLRSAGVGSSAARSLRVRPWERPQSCRPAQGKPPRERRGHSR